MRTFVLVLLAFLTLPAFATAHGIGEVYALPVPLRYYLLGAGLAVAFSFFVLAVFLNKNKATDQQERKINTPWLPATLNLSRFLAVVLLLLTIFSGIIGDQEPYKNFAPIFFWIYFLIGMGVFNVILGNLWDKVNPWKLITKWINPPAISQYTISGITGAAFILGLFWFELVSGQSFVPGIIGGLLLLYTLVNILASQLFQNWYKNGELFSVLFGFIGKIAHFEISEDEKSIIVRSESKKLDGGLAPGWMLLVASILLAGASFDSLKETVMWFQWLRVLGFASSSILAPTIGIILAPLPFLLAYFLACWIMKQLIGSEYGTFVLSKKFVWSLIPIAFGYTLAHNFSLAVVSAPQMLALVSDPLGVGWNLFGTASFEQTSLLLSAKTVWFIEIGFIILAHIFGVWYAHVLALNIFKDPKSATNSQYPMVILMIGFTVITLWLLSQPLVVGM